MEKAVLIKVLEERFGKHPERHEGIQWTDVEKALQNGETDVLIRMEEAGGEIDVVKEEDGRFLFFDCAAESPAGRRSLCYDEAALAGRKNNKPVSSAENIAADIGAEILNEEDYFYLQSLGEFDVKSQSWIATDEGFRSKGDALFGSRRHGRTFIYFNGAGSYYSIRGFRCKSKL